MATVLVIDDEDLVLSLLQRGLRAAGHEVFTANNGLDGIGMARRHSPDVVVLDINMPGVDGFEVCRRLREDPRLSDIPLLFLTKRGEVEERVRGLEAGADDYLPKPFDITELQARVGALLRRVRTTDREDPRTHLQVGELTLDRANRVARVRDRTVELTPVEYDLLDHLLAHAGEVFSSDLLLQQVWGYSPGTGDTSLVRWHIRNLREKIEDDPSQPRYIRTVSRHGYTIAEEI